jgi:hypothetical protein
MPRFRPRPVLPSWLWLWFPPLLLIVIFPIRVFDHEAYRVWVDGEIGLIELATPLLSLLGAFYGALLLRDLWRQGPPSKLMVWVGLHVLACIYFAGEEISWGQHLLGWGTPEYIAGLNDQGETNLHNMSSWFDQKPRLLLELWVLIGGIIVPLRGMRSRRRLSADVVSSWFWPTLECVPTAVLAILIRAPERMKDVLAIESLPYEIRWSEPQEYYFALFLLVYLAALRRRVKLARL